MPDYEVTMSKEAGVYTKTVYVTAKNPMDAQNKAWKHYEDDDQEEWKYEESYFEEPLIQVEEVDEC